MSRALKQHYILQATAPTEMQSHEEDAEAISKNTKKTPKKNAGAQKVGKKKKTPKKRAGAKTEANEIQKNRDLIRAAQDAFDQW